MGVVVELVLVLKLVRGVKSYPNAAQEEPAAERVPSTPNCAQRVVAPP